LIDLITTLESAIFAANRPQLADLTYAFGTLAFQNVLKNQNSDFS